MTRARILIVGGAGFVGSHFTDVLLAAPDTELVTLYDNFSSGREWHYREHAGDDRLAVVRADANDLDRLSGAMAGHDLVIHLASNPDIAAAMADPTVDFDQGTLITHHVLEAMRRTGVTRVAYASGSGDLSTVPGPEALAAAPPAGGLPPRYTGPATAMPAPSGGTSPNGPSCSD